MNTDDAFLTAIVANPDDHALRFAYADWLDDQGQPGRAEFVRLLCYGSTLPADHPEQARLKVAERVGVAELHALIDLVAK